MRRPQLLIICLVAFSFILITIQYRWTSLFSLSNSDRMPLALDEVFKSKGNTNLTIQTMLQEAFVAGNNGKAKGFLTIGIPTVKRQKDASYLLSTISGLINNSREDDLREITLLIFLADMDNSSRMHVYNQILGAFSYHIESGLIHIIRAPTEFYPSLEGLPRTYGHSETKVKWRSKQNFDYAFMMLYSEHLSEYYLQLEDDVETVPDYIQIIKGFIEKQKRKPWTSLEFSALGFIAKLYHSYDLVKLAKMLILFFFEQPNDVLYLYFNEIKLQKHRIVRKPTIFKHLGLLSSLAEKVERRQDPLFKDESSVPENNASLPVNTILNPPAKLKSTFRIYDKMTADLCYSGKNKMWTFGPRKGHRLTILFDKPRLIYNVKVVTGTEDNPDDFLQSGALQIGLKAEKEMCSDIISAQAFELGEAFIEFDKHMQTVPIACVQVLTLANQQNWLQVGEISIRSL